MVAIAADNSFERALLFKEFCNGRSKLSDRDRFSKFDWNAGENTLTALRAMGVSQATAGAKTVPGDFYDGLWATLADTTSVLRVASIIESEAGHPLEVPTCDDDVAGELIAESGADSDASVVIDSATLNAHRYSSGLVRASRELVQDAEAGVQRQLALVLGRRLGRITNAHLTTGSGVNQPMGVLTAASVGVTAAGTTEVTYDELVDLQHSVSEPYYEKAGWMFNGETLKTLKKMTDDAGRPLWQPSTRSGEGTILGAAYTLNPNMPSIGAEAKPILFGDFSGYAVRTVKATELLIYRERFAEFGQVGLRAVVRMDGDLLDQQSLVCLQMAS